MIEQNDRPQHMSYSGDFHSLKPVRCNHAKHKEKKPKESVLSNKILLVEG
jgi:hypothetical protein